MVDNSANIVDRRITKLFLDIQPVSKKGATQISGYQATWYARGTGTKFIRDRSAGLRKKRAH